MMNIQHFLESKDPIIASPDKVNRTRNENYDISKVEIATMQGTHTAIDIYKTVDNRMG